MLAIGYAALQWFGRTAGATRTERSEPLPGDALVDHPLVRTPHATTIHAPPDRIWPWLVQMGWHRGGWYTASWVDRLLFPANAPSADQKTGPGRSCSSPSTRTTPASSSAAAVASAPVGSPPRTG